MKDKNGIEICCQNCEYYDGKFCDIRETFPKCIKKDYFIPTTEAYEARIAELQEHNDILQKRVAELSMELLDYNMKENKDVLERLKEE